MSTYKTYNHAYATKKLGVWKKSAATFRGLLDNDPDCHLYQVMYQFFCSQYCKAVDSLKGVRV